MPRGEEFEPQPFVLVSHKNMADVNDFRGKDCGFVANCL